MRRASGNPITPKIRTRDPAPQPDPCRHLRVSKTRKFPRGLEKRDLSGKVKRVGTFSPRHTCIIRALFDTGPVHYSIQAPPSFLGPRRSHGRHMMLAGREAVRAQVCVCVCASCAQALRDTHTYTRPPRGRGKGTGHPPRAFLSRRRKYAPLRRACTGPGAGAHGSRDSRHITSI